MIFLPELHQLGLTDADWEGLCTLAEARQVDNEGLLRIQTNAALLGRWESCAGKLKCRHALCTESQR